MKKRVETKQKKRALSQGVNCYADNMRIGGHIN